MTALLFVRCSKPGCLAHAGGVTTVVRPAMPFHRIDLYDNVHLMLRQDTVESIAVEANEGLQPNVATSIDNGILTIRNNTECSWLRDPSETVRVYVSVRKLDTLNYNGSGNITSTNTLVAECIRFYSYEGAGNVDISLDARCTDAIIEFEDADYHFRGKSDYCFSYVNARGTLDLKDFEVKDMVIWYGGVRNATIYVTGTLKASILHTGNVYYKGSPTILDTIYYSTGRLLRAP